MDVCGLALTSVVDGPSGSPAAQELLQSLRQALFQSQVFHAAARQAAAAGELLAAGSAVPSAGQPAALAGPSAVAIGLSAAEAGPWAAATELPVAAAGLSTAEAVAAAGLSAAAAAAAAGPSAAAAAAGPSAAAATTEPSAAAAGPSVAWAELVRRTRTGWHISSSLGLLNNLAHVCLYQQDETLGAALLTSLHGSRFLDHAGRLVFLLLQAPGPGAFAPTEQLLRAQGNALKYLNDACDNVIDVMALPDGHYAHGLRRLTDDVVGPCGCLALTLMGACYLSAADGLPCGLPYNPIAVPLDTATATYPTVHGAPVSSGLLAVALRQLVHPLPFPPRAAVRLAIRALRLAGASAAAACDESRLTTAAPRYGLRVQCCWVHGRRPSLRPFAALLPAAEMARVAAQALHNTVICAHMQPRVWAAEAAAAWPELLDAMVHCLYVMEPAARDGFVQDAVQLMSDAVLPLFDAPGEAPRLLSSPAQLPPAAAAAIAGGVPARQAAAFLATLAKILRRTDPADLLFPVDGYGKYDARGAWVLFGIRLIKTALTWLISGVDDAEAPGPVNPSRPCAPAFVLALAVRRLLPELSRLTREAAGLKLGQPRAGPGPGPSAGPGGPKADEDELDTQIATWVNSLWFDVVYASHVHASSRGPGSPPDTRLSTALGLRALAEEAQLVPVLGALLDLAWAHGGLPGAGPVVMPKLGRCLACLALNDLLHAWGSVSAGAQPGPGGPGPGPHGTSARACWRPEALQWLAAQLAPIEPDLYDSLNGLAIFLRDPSSEPEAGPERRAGGEGREGAGRGGGAEAEAALHALRAEARALLPACANPACANLAGDSEAGLRLQHCGRCGRVSYCCRECQTAHWRAGHKAVCQGGGRAG